MFPKAAVHVKEIFFLVGGWLFLSACGLDTYYYLDPPVTDGHSVSHSNNDRVQDYFSFRAIEYNIDGFDYLGTEVYYKIYNNLSDMTASESDITALNSGSDTSSAANGLITRGYRTFSGVQSPLVKDNDVYVYIRLNDYGSDGTYRAVIQQGASKIVSYSAANRTLGIPSRSISTDTSYGFNFSGKSGSSSPLPKSTDEDAKISSATSSGTWYVDLYAVAVGRDESYVTSYSKVLFLGSTSIQQSWYE